MHRLGPKRPSLSACRWLLLALALLVGCGEPLATPEPVFLQAAGSMAMGPLVTDLATAFSEQDPLVTVEVTGLGTQFGLRALGAGEADLALASWLPADLDPDWRATAIARDGIAIIVHQSNQVEGLGLLQLQDLFSGRTYDWTAVRRAVAQGQVQPVSREEGSGTRAAFEALVMGDQPVTPNAILAPSPQAMIDYVAAHPEAIGYVSMGSVRPDVKVLTIEGEPPTPDTAGRGSYPLTRELWLITANPPSRAVEDFVRFALSAAGQQIVGRRYGRVR
jgi:phosphate transport system substrate-binding protein